MDVGTAVTAAWSSGISMYGVLALLGIAGRAGWVDGFEVLSRPWVIALMLGLFVVELVADKVAYLDSAWDAVHTVLRPLAGAYVMTLATDATWSDPALALSGGGLALSSHSAKASTRLVVNASPEPVSNVVVSALEDGLVAVMMALAFAYPEVALAITLVLTIVSIVVAVALFRTARRLTHRVRAGRRRAHPD
jgi:hypothetical protein